MSNVSFSTNASVIIQILSGLIGISGIVTNIPEKHKILQSILSIEMIVQSIELIFYIFILKSMTGEGLPKMAQTRYFDWFISTPLMLLSIIMFFKYEEHLEKNIEQKLDFWDFLKTNRDNIIIIFVCNFLMLLFGYLGETSVIDMDISLITGFLFFGITFYYIYVNYAEKSKNATTLFYYILSIWGSYGIAALSLSDELKNNAYNILDLFAKNFFGLYLYYRISNVNNK
jgi:bacteriorhodopsin